MSATLVVPPAPVHLTATAAYRQITLSWKASAGATAYNVYRDTVSGQGAASPIAARIKNAPFVDASLTNGTCYCYRVQAVNTAGGSPLSGEASATPAPSPGGSHYLCTYWPGNGVDGTESDGDTAIFTFQPASENDQPPESAIVTITSRRSVRPGTSSETPQMRYIAVNAPGLRFTADNTAPPSDNTVASSTLAPPLPKPVWTPFDLNPCCFPNENVAMRALDDPDVMQRRAAVEWLGRWTAVDGGSYNVDQEAIRRRLVQQTSLILPLIRAVRELPRRDCRRAAGLLALMGTAAHPALPAICTALASPNPGDGMGADGVDSQARADLLSCLVRLCGGPDVVAPTLVGLLQDPAAETRCAAAAALQYCTDPTFCHTSPPIGAYRTMSGQEEAQWQAAFLHLVIPALAARVDDRAIDVRIAAAQSLEGLAWLPASRPKLSTWPEAVVPLGRASEAADPGLRLAALRALAVLPGDPSPAAAPLRAALHGGGVERDYAMAALSHATQMNRADTLAVFLADLTASDAGRRRAAAEDIHQTATILWTGGFGPDPKPLPNWYNDARLFRGSTPTDPTASASQQRLLTALTSAAADPDPATRSEVVSSFEKIVRATAAMRYVIRPGGAADPQRVALDMSLTQAASALQPIDSALATRLQDLRAQLEAPRASL